MGPLSVADRGRRGPLEWAVAGRALPGQYRSGDDYVVVSGADRVTMAMIDGLGHGPDAADAADRAVQTIRGLPGEHIDVLIERCHQALCDSRGAAITILQVSEADGVVTWLGVGNVDAWILRRDRAGIVTMESLMPAGGVVGQLSLPALRPRTAQLRGGNVIIMVTDGVTSSWSAAVRPGQPVTTTAQAILAHHARPADDALVLAALYRGAR